LATTVVEVVEEAAGAVVEDVLVVVDEVVEVVLEQPALNSPPMIMSANA
jgi:hypothetical protein